MRNLGVLCIILISLISCGQNSSNNINGISIGNFGYTVAIGNKLYSFSENNWKEISTEAPGKINGVSIADFGYTVAIGNKLYNFSENNWTEISSFSTQD